MLTGTKHVDGIFGDKLISSIENVNTFSVEHMFISNITDGEGGP